MPSLPMPTRNNKYLMFLAGSESPSIAEAPTNGAAHAHAVLEGKYRLHSHQKTIKNYCYLFVVNPTLLPEVPHASGL